MRYEDIVSNPGKPFAAGGILGGLYVFTTNDRWEEVELDSSAKILHKVGTSKKSYTRYVPVINVILSTGPVKFFT